MKRYRLRRIGGRLRRKHWLLYRIQRQGYIAFGGRLYIGSDVLQLWRR